MMKRRFLPIKTSREGWLSFIGSYLGAIGTVLLGWLALWQTKRYKKASDKTDETFRILQEKIKELVQTNTDLAEENKNANWLIMNGNRIQIKRKQFEKIIDTLETYQASPSLIPARPRVGK